MTKNPAPVPLPSSLHDALASATSPEERGIVIALLQRYGVAKATQLLPNQIADFDKELFAALTGLTPHPADSVLDPSTCLIHN